MQLLEKFSLDCGISPFSLKREAPYSSFVPICSEGFVLFSAFSEKEEREFERYSLLQEAFDIVKPSLDKNNINYFFLPKSENESLIGCRKVNPSISIDKISYIAQRAGLFVGNMSIVSHVFDICGTPSISIVKESEKNKTSSYWKDKSHEFFYSERTSEIKPEVVANKILEVLNIKDNIEFKTIFVGEKFPSQSIEVVPDLVTSPEFAKGMPIAFRMDFLESPKIEHFKNALVSSINRPAAIVIDRIIPDILNLKREINQTQIKGILFNLKKELWDSSSDKEKEKIIEFIDSLSKIGKGFALGAKKSEFSEDERKNLKFLFLDICPILFSEESLFDLNKIEEDTENVFFKSSRFIFSNRKKFLSKQAYIEGKPVGIEENAQKLSEIRDLTSLSKELESSMIYFNK